MLDDWTPDSPTHMEGLISRYFIPVRLFTLLFRPSPFIFTFLFSSFSSFHLVLFVCFTVLCGQIHVLWDTGDVFILYFLFYYGWRTHNTALLSSRLRRLVVHPVMFSDMDARLRRGSAAYWNRTTMDNRRIQRAAVAVSLSQSSSLSIMMLFIYYLYPGNP